MQSGRAKTEHWVLECESLSRRHPEPLMGWTASADTLNQVRIKFSSKEEAVAFAKKKGWTYTLQKSHRRKIVPRNYGDNFRYIPPEDTD